MKRTINSANTQLPKARKSSLSVAKKSMPLRFFHQSPTLSSPHTQQSILQPCQRDDDNWAWYAQGELMCYQLQVSTSNTQRTRPIAAFDFDGCLAQTSLYNSAPDAWSVRFPTETVQALQLLHDKGYTIVILSNQSGIGRATKTRAQQVAKVKTRIKGFIDKVQSEILESGVSSPIKGEKRVLPIQALVATEKVSSYRKPEKSMWLFLESLFRRDNIKLCYHQSFYVGDAAGRARDFSDSDRKFAENVGIRFYDETEFFLERAFEKLK